MATFVLGLDAGHGLKTPGKQTPNGVKEWTINDGVCDKITDLLAPYDVKIIRLDNNEGNVDEELGVRFNRYMREKVDAVVSIHHNAFKGVWGNATGVEVYTDNNPTAKDVELAKGIYSRLPEYTGLKGRGVKKANFYIINQNVIPAVLIEGGFMDTKKDYNIITSATGQLNYAKAVVEALVDVFNIQKKPVAKPAAKPVVEEIKATYQVWDDARNKWLPNVVETEDYAGIIGHDVCAVYANLNKGNIVYKVHTKGGKWLPEVKNRSDYAGIFNKPIDGLMMKTDTGKTVRYRVHVRATNKWLPWVTGYNQNDHNNGYAGIIGKTIDAIQIDVV